MRTDFRELRDAAITAARAAGCDGADVLSYASASLSCGVRDGALEDSERAESQGIGIRVFVGDRAAYASTADCTLAGVRQLLEHLVPAASVVPADPLTRLARADELAKTIPDVPMCDDAPDPTIAQLIDMAKAAEDTGRAARGISRSDGAGAGFEFSSFGLSTSNGFCGDYDSSYTHMSVSLIAGQDDGMERDSASTMAVRRADLEGADIIGARAAQRTLERLNPRVGKTGAFPVLFDRRVSASLVRSLVRSVSGSRLAKKTSFLNDALGTQIFPRGVQVFEDPLKPYALQSRPFDGEGLPVSARTIVSDGVLNGVFLDLRSAARLNMVPTGSASRGLSSPPSPSPANLWMAAGDKSVAQLCADIGEGFLVTELLGAQISLSTGDYSRGASGFWVEGGKIAYPVAEMTIAGNLKDMFARITPADDLEFRYGIDAPTLLVEGMMTATRD